MAQPSKPVAGRTRAGSASLALQLRRSIEQLLHRVPVHMREVANEVGRSLRPQPALVLQLEQLLKERERLADDLRAANELLVQLAMTDPLTGMSNRRYFDEALHRDLARTERQGGATLTLVLIDADHFKDVNDTYGHNGGDIVLKEIATVLRESTRVSDVAARVGGEEFALILPQTSSDNALVVAERVRTRVAARKIAHDDGRIMQASVSVGLATACAPGCRNHGKVLYEAADRALYAAKGAGRNNVQVAKL